MDSQVEVEVEEYKLIQGKFDKIGEFRFKIKEWSVTLVLAFLLGTRVFQAPAPYLLMLYPVLLLFWLMERRQLSIQNALGKRVNKLEYVIKKCRRDEIRRQPVVLGQTPFRPVSPGIADAIDKGKKRKPDKAHRIRNMVRHAERFVSEHLETTFYSFLGVIVAFVIAAKLIWGDTSSETPRERVHAPPVKITVDVER